VLEATDASALDVLPLELLKRYAVEDEASPTSPPTDPKGNGHAGNGRVYFE
jgi:hypothetical protein